MKKTKVQSVEIPASYALLEKPTRKICDRKVVIDTTGKIYVLPSADSPVPVEVTVDRIWKSFEEFADIQEQSILAYHEQYLGQVPKKQNITTTASYVWAWFVKEGKPILDNVNIKTGEKKRQSTLGTRKYFLGSVKLTDQLKTAQAIKCLEFVTDGITEEELKRVVNERQAELKTKQDPWRIFQYYRSKLISLKLLRYE